MAMPFCLKPPHLEFVLCRKIYASDFRCNGCHGLFDGGRGFLGGGGLFAFGYPHVGGDQTVWTNLGRHGCECDQGRPGCPTHGASGHHVPDGPWQQVGGPRGRGAVWSTPRIRADLPASPPGQCQDPGERVAKPGIGQGLGNLFDWRLGDAFAATPGLGGPLRSGSQSATGNSKLSFRSSALLHGRLLWWHGSWRSMSS